VLLDKRTPSTGSLPFPDVQKSKIMHQAKNRIFTT
jgi:hypothetical protein